MNPDQIHDLLQATLSTHIASDAQIVSVVQHSKGAQGFSNATLSYYDVTYAQGGANKQVILVTKDASLIERRTLTWLGAHTSTVPFSFTFDLSSESSALLCMQFVGSKPSPQERVRMSAPALAAIHAAAFGRREELSWVPLADPPFIADWLIQGCWRAPWLKLLNREMDDNGILGYGPIKPGGDFRATFEEYTQPLEEAAAKLLEAVTELWEAGDTLTLIHGDFHHEQVRCLGERGYVLDWDFAHYGSFYLDLPNYFTPDEVLQYRDALASAGHPIAQEEFLTRYHAVRTYPGFKYITLGLWNWCYGDPPHQPESVLHFVKLVLNDR